MANLSITTAWNETTAFLGREGRLVFPIALLLLALPSAAMQLATPMSAGETPEFSPLALILLPFLVVASLVGTIAISFLALRPGVSVGEALQVGLRRFVMLLLASLLIALAFAIVLFFLLLVLVGGSLANLAAPGAAGGTAAPGAEVGTVVLVALLLMLAALFLWVRLMLMTPVAAVEPAGPIEIIRRSWQLTAGFFWKLLGFVLLLLVAAIVIMMVVGMLFGIVVMIAAGPPQPGSTAFVLLTILTALVQGLLSAVFVTLIARIYAQLAGDSPERVVA